MVTLYLLRHCEYENPSNIVPGRLPYPLSQKGLDQSSRLREYFKDKKINKIFTSPILRCVQTSQHISLGKIPVEEDTRLTEILNSYQGHPLTTSFDLNRIKLLYGGESNKQVQNRMIDFYANTNFEDNHNYIICSHGDPILFLYQYLSGEDLMPDTHSNLEPNIWPGYLPKGSFLPIVISHDKKVQQISSIISL